MRQQSFSATSHRPSQALIGIISNCVSSTNREQLDRVRTVIGKSPHLFHYEFDDINALPEGLQLMADAGVALLIINGGDGTIQATLTHIINDRPFTIIPPIAILPGGKTNLIADDLKCKGSPASVLKRVIKTVRRGKLKKHLVERNLIALDLADGKPPRYGMFFGGAAVIKGILWSRTHIHQSKVPTRFGHALAIIRLILKAAFSNEASPLRSGQTTITMGDEQRYDGEFYLILVTTLSRLMLGLRPFGRDGNGGLKTAIIDSRPKVMRQALLALLTRRFHQGKVAGVYTARTDHMLIDGDDPVTLDGEIYTPTPGKPIHLDCEKSLNFLRL
ncbi:putative lipid kinase [alpha proteobacterium Q-1]|nr:putative lipid kinase [alpha proteobacterium Q-1]